MTGIKIIKVVVVIIV